MAITSTRAQGVDVWLGTSTSTGGPSRGIYHTSLNTTTGHLADVRLAAAIDYPGFLAQHPTASRLYAAAQENGAGIIAAYAIESSNESSVLKLLNTVTIPEGRATHLAVDRTGSVLLTAQYHAGTTALFALADDNSVGRHVKSIQHQGPSGVVSDRQEAAHAHWVGTAPDNQFVLVPDLGLDKVMIYRLQLNPAPNLWLHGFGQAAPGAGPRHMTFHLDGQAIYVANELAVTVTTFDYDAELGTMSARQTIASVSAAGTAREKSITASEIQIHPNGRFVYVANRGPDSITVFRVEEPTRELSLVQHESVRGSHPRHFAIDPSGRWLLAAGRDSNTLAVFEIDGETGRLTFSGQSEFVPTPTCVLFGRTPQ